MTLYKVVMSFHIYHNFQEIHITSLFLKSTTVNKNIFYDIDDYNSNISYHLKPSSQI